jgi:hypothetical protein
VIGRAARRLSTRRTRLHALTAACATRAAADGAGNQVRADGATALAAALKDNATLTTLGLGCACSGTASHPAALPRPCTCG